ncbi:MAG: cation-translocating P-type ATPase [Candidatus Saccharimonadales bacterium]
MKTVGPDKRLNYYSMTPDDVIADLHSHRMGLTNVEAARRLEQHGANILFRAPHESLITTFLRQFKNLFVIMLLISAAFALYLHDGRTATILIIIALMNASVGFFQEHKAETLMNNLEDLLVPRAKVIRNDKLTDIDSQDLVLGDIVYIEEGDSVPADLRIIEEEELTTNDFALTGESNPSRKFVHAISAAVQLPDRHNLAFLGTTVATGTARGIVIGTAMHTELGRIASLSQVTHAQLSPLQKEMNHLATRIAQSTLILAALLAIIALQANLGLKAALLFAIGISAAMIPNGLVAEVNITLAQTASRMAKARALVKKLSAVETLGATNIILTDKTGTLTKNEMTISRILIGRTSYGVTGTGYEPRGAIINGQQKLLPKKTLEGLSLFFITGALACNARVSQPDAQHRTWYVIGDPTEGAIVTLARKASLKTEDLHLKYREIREFQFDAARKLMSSIRHYEGKAVVFVKGAPEAVLGRSNKLWDHGHIRKFTAADRTFFITQTEMEAKNAMRNLAFAYRILPKNVDLKELTMDEAEKDFTFLGIVSMQDPLRDDVPRAMAAARSAHVHVSVVTGDYPTTAEAVAVQAGLAVTLDQVKVVGTDELSVLSDSQVYQLIIEGGVIFSRATPEDKLRIVEIGKASGLVVAVTGDGINDAPALKHADIGVAMGKTGTDVAKDAAEIVLLDDSFSTLVGAIEQGRLTFYNIRKAAHCAMTDNAGELIVILMSLVGQIFFHIPIAITAIQILAIDIIAQMAPVTALGWDKAERSLIHQKPRRLSDHILNVKTVPGFIMFGALGAVLAYSNFLFFFVRHGLSAAYIDTSSSLYAQATMLTYLTLVLCQFVYLMMARADEHESFFTRFLWSNKKLLIAFAISFFCIFNIMYNPLISSYFGAGPLSVADWLAAVGAALIYLVISLLQRHTRKHTRQAIIKLHREVHGNASPARI